MDDHFKMTSATTKQPALDTEALERILGLGDAALREALCQQLIADFERLRDALTASEPSQVGRAAHELKGLAATVGATLTSDLARNLDLATQTLPIAASEAMVPVLQGQIDRVLAELRANCDGRLRQ